MLRSTIILAAITAISFVVANRTLPVPQLRIISSDTKARFLEVHINKAVTIDLPRDVKEVLVGDAKTVTVVVRTMRRIYIVGAVLGNTNVFFYDDDGGQIAALDVCVSDYHRPRNDPPGIGSHQAKVAALDDSPVVETETLRNEHWI
jgi:Flp pilus assembly secretin CpaC